MTDRTVKVVLDGDVSRFNRALMSGVATTKAFTKELDTSTDRSANLVQGLLAVGPALVPIATAGIPALAGLSNQLAITAAAGGVAILTFNGVGEALKAVNDFQIDPTAANLEKLQQTMDDLGPAGRDFVAFLQSIRPELQGLQDAGQAGMFPGVQVGIEELLTRGPQAERIISEIASAVGTLTAEAGTELAGPEWDEFFTFLETEAKPTLMDMGRTVGNLTAGFAQLWMAFAPTSANFSDSFLRMSRDFSSWASTVDETEGFEEFLDYLARTGPEVWDTLGALANALLQIGEAAAPVGAVALPIIENVADTIAVIADSDVGPVLIGTAAGISAISRAVALYNVANGSALATLLGGTTAGAAGRNAKDLRGSAAAYLDFGAALDKSGPAVGKYASTTDRLKASMGGVGRIVGGLGAIAFAASDLDDSLGLSNTVMLTLAGSLAGPWGAAAGAAIGITRDLGAATAGLSDALDAANKAADGGSIEQREAAMASLREEVEKAREGEAGFGQRIAEWSEMANGSGSALGGLAVVVDKFTTSSSEAGSELSDLEKKHAVARQQADDQAFAEAGLGDAMANASDAARDQTSSLLRNIDALNARRDAVLDSRSAERELQAAIDDAAASIKENGATLDTDTEEGRANEAALDRIAAAWNNLEPAAQAAKGAMDETRAAFIRTAMDAGKSRRAAEALADKLLDIPPAVSTRFTLYGAPEAGSALSNILSKINALPSQKTIGIKVVGGTTTRQADGGFWDTGVRAFADGGFDEHGNRVPRVPQMRSGSQGIVQWAEPETGWEAYISGKPGMEARNIGVLMQAAQRLGVHERLSARRYADGALVSPGLPATSVAAAAATAAAPSLSDLRFTASIKGARVEIGRGGIARFVDGRIEVHRQADESHGRSNDRQENPR